MNMQYYGQPNVHTMSGYGGFGQQQFGNYNTQPMFPGYGGGMGYSGMYGSPWGGYGALQFGNGMSGFMPAFFNDPSFWQGIFANYMPQQQVVGETGSRAPNSPQPSSTSSPAGGSSSYAGDRTFISGGIGKNAGDQRQISGPTQKTAQNSNLAPAPAMPPISTVPAANTTVQFGKNFGKHYAKTGEWGKGMQAQFDAAGIDPNSILQAQGIGKGANRKDVRAAAGQAAQAAGYNVM